MKYSLVYYGHPALRSKSKPVEAITDEIIEVVAEMVQIMDEYNGVGLAAPQIAVNYRLFVIRPEIKLQTGEFALGEPEVFINPKLSSPMEEKQTTTEGCLSIPKLHIDIERPLGIHIEAMNLKGEKISEKVVGFKAIEIMHENDHLNGILFVDRIKDEKIKKHIAPFLTKMKKETKKRM